jgi:hypothetical protein
MNGNDRRRLFLPFSIPIISITSLTISGREIPAVDYEHDENSIWGVHFIRGTANVEIEGTYGVVPCPSIIKQICIMLVGNENDPDLYQKYFFKSEKSGEYSYTRGDDGALWTGIPEVDSLFQLWRSFGRRPIIL